MINRDWTDAELLQMLDLRANGVTATAIAEALGCGRSAVLAVTRRIAIQTDKSDPDGHRDGTMPDGWWRKGLRKQGRLAATLRAA
jgi:hypothetical protein